MSGHTIIPYEDKLKQSVFDFTDCCFKGLGKSFEPDGRHHAYNDIDKNFVVFYCLLSDNKVKGTVALKAMDDNNCELKALYLDPGLRGLGLGRELMNMVILKARELGYRSIFLDSMSQYKEAMRLYERAGFMMIDRYNDNYYADVFMKLDL